MNAPKSVCVFCGHQPGADPAYMAAARAVGKALAEARVDLVYGGGHMGMMGAMADACLNAGGRAIGVIPNFLTRLEAAHKGLTEMILVEDMDVRKHRMFALSEAFIVLPGGFGTLDETFEAITLSQLQVHHKPLVVVNIQGFFDPLRAMVADTVGEGFASPEHGRLFQFVPGVSEAMTALGLRHTKAAQ
ncbi:MAG: Rossman fold protein, TIGR00730 family [Alphaproteobacteria bacterium RIFOXYD12_FULL_60_8]|nr:MAG: Rossman fold protein, TIGR00730 family [Alphaproteobacteria bacterium RIFOXYD12_FULL_60_8]